MAGSALVVVPGDRKERAFSPLLALDFGGVALDDTRFNLLVGVTGAEIPCSHQGRRHLCREGLLSHDPCRWVCCRSVGRLPLLTISPWLSGSTVF